jgi:hypothetical protein
MHSARDPQGRVEAPGLHVCVHGGPQKPQAVDRLLPEGLDHALTQGEGVERAAPRAQALDEGPCHRDRLIERLRRQQVLERRLHVVLAKGGTGEPPVGGGSVGRRRSAACPAPDLLGRPAMDRPLGADRDPVVLAIAQQGEVGELLERALAALEQARTIGHRHLRHGLEGGQRHQSVVHRHRT